MFGLQQKSKLASDWIDLVSADQLNLIDLDSESTLVVIFKHSTRCGTSSFVLDRLLTNWVTVVKDVKLYFLDLIQYREISNTIARKYDILHESPQLIVISKGKAIADTSHNGVDINFIKTVVEAVKRQ